VALPVVNPNRKAVEFGKPDKINWDRLSSNPCGDAVKLLRENPENQNALRIFCATQNQLGLLVGQHLQQNVSMLGIPRQNQLEHSRSTPQTG
jgi:hypothetical protein